MNPTPPPEPQRTPWAVLGIGLALSVGSAVLLAIGGLAAARALPEPASLAAVELHAAPASAGVRVPLG